MNLKRIRFIHLQFLKLNNNIFLYHFIIITIKFIKYFFHQLIF